MLSMLTHILSCQLSKKMQGGLPLQVAQKTDENENYELALESSPAAPSPSPSFWFLRLLAALEPNTPRGGIIFGRAVLSLCAVASGPARATAVSAHGSEAKVATSRLTRRPGASWWRPP